MSLFLTSQGIWIPEGETVKLPVAIKVIQDRTGQKTFNKPTDVRKHSLCVTPAPLPFTLIVTEGLSLAVHDNSGKLGPREHSPGSGHLSRRQPPAHQPAQ